MIEKQDEQSVTIADIGSESMSVTNDAEAVVLELQSKGILRDRRLFYYDSAGQLDELKHDGNGRFVGFAPGPR